MIAMISLQAGAKMPALTIRNLSPETHQALKLRAVRNGRSTEAEVRVILDQVTSRPPSRNVADLFAAFRAENGGLDLEVGRDRTTAEPLAFD